MNQLSRVENCFLTTEINVLRIHPLLDVIISLYDYAVSTLINMTNVKILLADSCYKTKVGDYQDGHNFMNTKY
jgi:hypothetical protein